MYTTSIFVYTEGHRMFESEVFPMELRENLKEKILTTKLLDSQIALFYVGQEGFLIKYRETYVLIDAYLSDFVDRHSDGRGLGWTRNYPAPIAAEELDFVDYVFCSHEHCDHADPDTLGTLAAVNSKATYIVPAPIVSTICSYGVPAQKILPARDGVEIALDRFFVLPIASAHEELHQDANGDYCELGYKFTFGTHTVYHSGDCCIYDGLAEKIGSVDIAMLPVNGRDYYRFSTNIIGNMDSGEALELADLLNARLLIPMHFDLYDGNGIPAGIFVQCAQKRGNHQAYHIFQPGEKYIFG